MDDFHIGEKIKIVVESKGMAITKFAKLINKSRENVYSIFNRKTIDTGLLMTISKVLEHDFFQYFSESNLKLASQISLLEEEIKMLRENNNYLRSQLDLRK